jgi:hypothetical protein
MEFTVKGTATTLEGLLGGVSTPSPECKSGSSTTMARERCTVANTIGLGARYIGGEYQKFHPNVCHEIL